MVLSQQFDRLYAMYASSVYAYMKVCAGEDNAPDLTQNVFMNLWRHMRETKTLPDNPKAWLFRAAVNVKNDWLRVKYRTPAVTELTETLESPEQDLTHSAAIDSAMQGLDSDTREILTLRGMGFDSGELAEVFGISASAARSRLQKAKRLFVEKLSECGVNIDE